MTKREPFERLDTEVLVDNPWHRYRLDSYVQRDGSIGRYYYVDMPGSAATIPLFEDGSTVLVEVYRYLLGTTLWEFPIGGMKEGEEPVDVAQRELEEEAGLVARKWQALGAFAPYKGASNELCHFFLAEELTWTEQRLEPSEDIRVHRMSLADARRRLVDQAIGDGQSWGGLVLLDRFRESRGEEKS